MVKRLQPGGDLEPHLPGLAIIHAAGAGARLALGLSEEAKLDVVKVS